MTPDTVPEENSRTDRFQQLLEQVRAGSQEAAWELVENYAGHIRAVVRRRMHPGLRAYLDSEDFVQSVWKSFFRAGPRLRDIDSPAQLVALLARMSGNKVIDEVRRRTQTEKHALPHHGVSDDSQSIQHITSRSQAATPSQIAIARERWALLVDNQTEVTRKIIELRLSGRTHVEIAEELKINERTVRRTMSRLMDDQEDLDEAE